MAIHPTAVVDPSAEVGDVQIGPFAVVGAGVTLHDGVVLAAHAVVLGTTTVGAGTRVHSFACLGGDPQDLKYAGEPTRLEIGERNTFREYVTVHRGTEQGGSVTRIGDDCLFMAQAHVAHDCQLGNGIIFANSAAIAGHVTMGDHAVMGGLAGVHQHCRIGRRAMVAAGAMAALDVPPFSIAQGDRARLFGLNIVGLRRGGFSADTIDALRSAWRELFVRSKPLRLARSVAMERWGEVAEVRELVDFLERTQRGICRAAQAAPDIDAG